MNYYCTLFDSVYLSRGLAMYHSLSKHAKQFHLFVFSFDEQSYIALQDLALEHVTAISLKEFETPELLDIKDSRTKGEYCWTCTPSTISHVLNVLKLPNCTYLDSDLLFYSDPEILINEMIENHKDVLITEHRFSPVAKFFELKRAGRFCVQFVTFTNSKQSLDILNTWRLQCIEWCYARYEDGKFGDQKYLDLWPENYTNVHILNNPGGGIAPWNLQQYDFIQMGDKVEGKELKTGKHFDVVFFHFQYVRRITNLIFDIGWYRIPRTVKKVFYLPYLVRLNNIDYNLLENNYGCKIRYTRFETTGLKSFIKTVLKKCLSYNLIKVNI